MTEDHLAAYVPHEQGQAFRKLAARNQHSLSSELRAAIRAHLARDQAADKQAA